MKLTTHDIGGVSVLTLDGTILGGPDAAEINSTLHKLIDAKKKKVVIDLGAVNFMGSLGMRTLVVAAKAVAKKGGKLVLLKPQPNVDRALRTSGIDTVIPIARDSAGAAALLN